ncbi:TRAP transporter large permease [Salinisphaera hydrothermalis]|uniref:TRAP transporter large permease protein n=1 Tax=Salinisphaera hydrothermalis (strain C41B8) TaxID=1304275 RepID=A0A084IPU8_SALHC|nr:TRAP transporter large permease [Salinisphaera hydrothermalis]KEZ78732.1 TRAP transporter large transmembrane protein [Salinisphaera hydrothermalis C41B8]
MFMLGMLAALLVLIAIGIPISIGLAGISIYLMMHYHYAFSPLIQQGVNGLDSFPLLAIPLFIMVGEVMSHGGIARRLVRFASSLVGFMAGGLGQIAVLTSMFFGGISGSAVADASAIGGMLIRPMKEKGYSAAAATAIVVGASVVGIIVPPSIPMILFGVVTNTSISNLFLAGIVPGILVTIGLMITTYATSRSSGAAQSFSVREVIDSFFAALPALMLPLIIVGGILGGVFTPTESSAIALIYAIVVSLFFYRTLTLKKLFQLFVNTGQLTGVVLLLLTFANVLAWLLTANMVPQHIVAALTALTDQRFVMLMILIVVLLLVGFFMDLTPAMVILAPLMTPVVTKLGIDPVYFGVLMSFALGIGLITPPVGTVLYVGCGVGDVPMEKLSAALLPYYAVLLALLFLFILFPGIVLWYQ